MSHVSTSDPKVSPASPSPSVNVQSISLSRKKRVRGGYRAHATKLIDESLSELERENLRKQNVTS